MGTPTYGHTDLGAHRWQRDAWPATGHHLGLQRVSWMGWEMPPPLARACTWSWQGCSLVLSELVRFKLNLAVTRNNTKKSEQSPVLGLHTSLISYGTFHLGCKIHCMETSNL